MSGSSKAAPEGAVEGVVGDFNPSLIGGEEVKLSGKALDSGESEDVEVFRVRSKLYRFATDVLGKEGLQERALGDIRLTRHNQSGKFRLLMREEKMGYVRLNMFVDPSQDISPHPSKETLLIFGGNDFSDANERGEAEAEAHTFGLRVKTADFAKAFTNAYNKAREANTSIDGGAAPESTKNAFDGFPKTVGAPAAAAAGGAAAGGAGSSGPASGAGAPSPAAAAPAPAPPAIESQPVPEFEGDLSKIYPGEEESAGKRYADVSAKFAEKYGAPPAFFVRAPGRVNVIGEHVDYHMYPVLPFAVKYDIMVAVGFREDGEGTVKVANTVSSYDDGEFPAEPIVGKDADGKTKMVRKEGDEAHWWHYVQCGQSGAFEAAQGKGSSPAPRGLNLMVHGNVPVAGGLSSSSALVVASTLAFARAHDVSLTTTELGHAAWQCEAKVGTMGGGMDQAISAMGQEGKVVRVSFHPELQGHAVPMPGSPVFVVANSNVQSAKAESADYYYNRRVTESKMAAKLAAKAKGIEGWKEVSDMRDLQEKLSAGSPQDLVPVLEETLSSEGYSVEDLKKETGVESPGELMQGQVDRATAALGSVSSPDAKELMLLQRARHVATESGRLQAFVDTCMRASEAGDGSAGVTSELGRLMNESQASCRDDFGCSIDELDEMCGVAREAGALGARLTGAGWGGCIVAMCGDAETADAVQKALQEKYYGKQSGTSPEDVEQLMFQSKPLGGAAIYVEADDL